MNAILILVILWMARLIITFPLTASAFINNKKNDIKIPSPIKVMSIHTLLAFLLQVSTTTLYFLHINYMFLIHIYIVEEFVLDMLFYRELLKKTHAFKDQPSKRKIFLVAIALFVAFAIINALFINNLNEFPTYTFIIQSIVMIIVTSCYDYVRSFYEPVPVITTEIAPFKLYKGPVFWMNKGKLLYFSIGLPLFILYNLCYNAKLYDISTWIWAMQNIVLITLHVFMGIGFLKFKANPDDVPDMQEYIKKVDDATKI